MTFEQLTVLLKIKGLDIHYNDSKKDILKIEI